jgi:formylmethanofuran:tetrahydromethanopterin formyltransferase
MKTYTVIFEAGNDEWHPPMEVNSEYSHLNEDGRAVYSVTVNEDDDAALEDYMNNCLTVICYEAE